MGQARAPRHHAWLLRLRAVRRADQHGRGAASPCLVLGGRCGHRGDRRAGLHDAVLADAAGRSRLPAATARRRPDPVRRAARQVRARRRLGDGGAGRAGASVRGAAAAFCVSDGGGDADQPGHRAAGGGGGAAAELGRRGPPVLVGAGAGAARTDRPVPAGDGLGPGPGAAPGQAPAARAPGQRLRRAPRRRLVAGRVDVLQRALVAAGGRRDRQGRQRAADSRRGLRARLVGRVRPHPVPRRRRAAGAGLHRRAGTSHAARVSDRGRRRLPAGADDRGPGVGGSRVRARPRRPARGGARRDCGPGPGQRRRSGRGRRRARGREQLRRAGSGGRARERRSHPGRRRCCGPDGERHSCAGRAGTEAPARKGAAGTAGQGTAARAGNSARR